MYRDASQSKGPSQASVVVTLLIPSTYVSTVLSVITFSPIEHKRCLNLSKSRRQKINHLESLSAALKAFQCVDLPSRMQNEDLVLAN